jgi:uncharacterized membrane protein YgaE (UPF0421/DUF939 family)
MTNQNQKKQDKRKGSVNSVVAGVTGAVIGAGIAVAGAAVVLNDKKNREKVKKVLTNVKKQAIGYMEGVQKQAQDKKGEVEEKLVEGKEKVKKEVNSA